MRTAAPRERRDHDTLLPPAGAFATAVMMLAAVAATPPTAAVAQGVVPCTAIQNDAERLACYDRALRPAAPAAPAAQAPAPTPAPAAAAPPASAAPTAPAVTAPAPAPAAAAPAGRAAPPASAQSSPAPSASPTAPGAQTAAAPPTSRDADSQPVSVTIVAVSTPQGRPAAFTADDGTTWVQTDSQRVAGLPATPFGAELKSGAMSSTFLVPEGRRAIRVRAANR